MSVITVKAKLVSEPLVDAIEKMRELLKQEFGADYSFVIMGRGEVVAASNLNHGEVKARSN